MTSAYSYVSFPTPQQKLGPSAERQLGRARKSARENGYGLDETLVDDGVSAYQGKNLRGGPLAQFLRAVDEGRVEAGAVLIVESLGRITRPNPRRALPHWQDIIDSGIAVVALIDGKRHTQEDMGKYPVLCSSRRHEPVRLRTVGAPPSGEEVRR